MAVLSEGSVVVGGDPLTSRLFGSRYEHLPFADRGFLCGGSAFSTRSGLRSSSGCSPQYKHHRLERVTQYVNFPCG